MRSGAAWNCLRSEEASQQYAPFRRLGGKGDVFRQKIHVDRDGIDPPARQRLLFSNALRPYDTLEELAAKEHLDLKTLKATLDRYNKDIAAGRDSEFGKDIAGSLSVPLTEPPFAACTIEPDLSYTQGGVLINTRAEAISALDDKPIPGLYVAGEASAGVFGVTRLTACSLPDCAAFGMIAGEEIAKRARNIKA